MDIVALVLSIVSIIVTIIFTIYELVENRKINDITLEAEYFDFLFKELLLKQIPLSRVRLVFDGNGKLTGADDLIEVLSSMRKNSIYFQYTNPKFYKKLKKQLQGIEDLLEETVDKKLIAEDQTIFFNELKEKMEFLYNLMRKKYLGKRIK
jgi:hypothetical protein